MNNKNNLKLLHTFITLFIFIFSTIPCVSCAVFNPICNINTINDENINKPIIISVLSDDEEPLPEEFNVKIAFDNNVFKKNTRIDYNPEVSSSYRHNKSVFGNEISVRCSLKPSKITPIIPKKDVIFSIALECKQSVCESETILSISAEGDFKSEKTDIPIRIQTTHENISLPLLTNLIPNCGNLNPPFNPNTTEYSLSVPHNVNDIKFDYKPDNNCSAKINRHKLESAGSTTDIYITVKSGQKGIKNVYHISVNRDSSPESDKSSNDSHSKAKSSSDKKSHKSNSKRKSSLSPFPKHKKYDCTDKCYELEEKPTEAKTIEVTKSENSTQNNQKFYSIIILALIIVITTIFLITNRKKILKSKISLNKISEK